MNIVQRLRLLADVLKEWRFLNVGGVGFPLEILPGGCLQFPPGIIPVKDHIVNLLKVADPHTCFDGLSYFFLRRPNIG